jgi:hypothetical protein
MTQAEIDEWLPGDGPLFIWCNIYRDDGGYDIYSNIGINDDASKENGKRFNAHDDELQYIRTVIPVPDEDSDVEEIDAQHPDFARMELMRSKTPRRDFEATLCDEEVVVIDDELTDLPEEVKQKKQKKRPKKKKQKERNKFFL